MKMTLDPDLAAEAKALVAPAFRNGPIEDLHAGRPCAACSGMTEVSHISDDEMKTLMKSRSISSIASYGSATTIPLLTTKIWRWDDATPRIGMLRNSRSQRGKDCAPDDLSYQEAPCSKNSLPSCGSALSC
jgi:hypothetical protein